MNRIKKYLASFKPKTTQQIFTIIFAAYVVGVIMQNIFEVYMIGAEIPLRGYLEGFGIIIAGGGTILSWLVFAAMDITTEVWGTKRAIKSFTAATLANIFIVALMNVLLLLPAGSPEGAQAIRTISAAGLRLTAASAIAFWVGNYINTRIFSRMKQRHTGTKGYELRAVVSTVFGQFVDNLLFNVLAFAPFGLALKGFGSFEFGTIWGETGMVGVDPVKGWVLLLITVCISTLLEVIIEAVFTPIFKRVTKRIVILKEQEEQNG